MNSHPPFEPRQSNWLDVIAFGSAFLAGVTAYFVLRGWVGQNTQLAVTLTLVVVMLIYALLIVRVPRLRVRMDQAGDNSYYLGLLFTLASMAFALYDFGAITSGATSGGGVQQIISNFGIALATTIVGIFLRVILHQMRVDPADLESMTRIELTEAADRLRTTLNSATTDLSRFHLELQQRSNDANAELLATVTRSSVAVAEGTAEALATLLRGTQEVHERALTGTEALTKGLSVLIGEAVAAAQRLRAIDGPSLTVVKRFERAAGALEAVADKSERTGGALAIVMDASNRSAQSIEATSEAMERLSVLIREQHLSMTENLRQALTGLSEASTPLAGRLQELLRDFRELEEQSKRSAAESVRAQEAAVLVLTAMTSLARELTAVANARR